MTERTRGKRPDYKLLHTTGEVVQKDISRSTTELRSDDEYLSVGQPSNYTVDHSTESFVDYRDHHTQLSSSEESSLAVSEDELELAVNLEDPVEAEEAKERIKMEHLQAMMNQLSIQEATIAEDIDDFLEENPIEDVQRSIEDLDVIINKRCQHCIKL